MKEASIPLKVWSMIKTETRYPLQSLRSRQQMLRITGIRKEEITQNEIELHYIDCLNPFFI